ncbi:alpha-tocopherol transfer protein-like [Teleopsis dalmanni]|uniref:alpha-tocopherol transfer protein-like n=1 Tax=Teleopsis dalmanni TaxID=139649 RepID=UPI0018CC9C7F|nr:alpha-tocopherol transfer protein-like [Teleopsis dalmanni]XP_037943786.1 alpha-tocopherol transfer protein-like [Teleopsis dalmanni]
MSNTIRVLTPALQELALENCNENPDTVECHISALQSWIKQSPHLKARMDKKLLLAFLRRCQFSMEETKKRIDAFYTMKIHCREFLCEREVTKSLIHLYNTGVYIIPIRPSSAIGPRIIIIPLVKQDPKFMNLNEIFKIFFMLLEVLAMEDDNATVAGIVFIFDIRDITMEQMRKCDRALLKKNWLFGERCMPLKLIEIHLIHMRRDTFTIYNIMSNFLSCKKHFKVFMHKKAEDIFRYLPREALPIEYGGQNGYQAEALEYWRHKLLQYTDYFANDDNFGTIEKNRICLTKRFEHRDFCGLNGSYRKLQVD